MKVFQLLILFSVFVGGYGEENLPQSLNLNRVTDNLLGEFHLTGYVDTEGNSWGPVVIHNSERQLVGRYNHINNQKEGPYVEHLPNEPSRLLVLINYVNGVPNGPFIHWYESGGLSFIGRMNDGRGDGMWTRFWENGEVMATGTYNNGKLLQALTRRGQSAELELVVEDGNGALSLYDPDGNQTVREVYREGELIR